MSTKVPLQNRTRSRARKKIPIDDVHMHNSGSSQLAYGITHEPDNNQTLINWNDDSADDWADEDPASNDKDYFHWEEEETLFSDLLEESSPELDDTQLAALVESLQEPFDDESRKLKKEIAGTFVPVVNKIRSVFSELESTVDIATGAGIIILNEGCRELESSLSSRYAQAKNIQDEYQAQIVKLLSELEDEYTVRDQLWDHFEKAMNELVSPTLELLHEAPTKMERIISSIEKQGRVLEKQGTSAAASATELTLKELLSTLK